MATEILRPQDCLSAQNFHSFSPQKLFPNRRKSRPVRTNQTAPSPSPKTKHGRTNPKSNRKSSSSPSTSPPSTSPLSTSPLQDGFRLLRRGEAFQRGQSGSDTGGSPGERTQLVLVKKREDPNPAELSTSPPKKVVSPSRRSEPPPQKKKNQSDRVGSRPEPTTPPPPPVKPSRVGSGSDEEELRYAGLNCSLSAPPPMCVPKPGFLMRSTSVDPTSDDEASRTLRGLLKLDFM